MTCLFRDNQKILYIYIYLDVREYRGPIENGPSRETVNIGYTRRRELKQITSICHRPCYKQLETKTNQTSFYAEIVTDVISWELIA